MAGPARTRRAESRDAAPIAALLAELGYPADPAAVAERLCLLTPSATDAVFVAEMYGRIAGVVHAAASRHLHVAHAIGRICTLVVAEGARGAGIGTELVAAAEEFLRGLGCGAVEVTSNVKRERAHRFYESIGYEGRSRRFIRRF